MIKVYLKKRGLLHKNLYDILRILTWAKRRYLLSPRIWHLIIINVIWKNLTTSNVCFSQNDIIRQLLTKYQICTKLSQISQNNKNDNLKVWSDIYKLLLLPKLWQWHVRNFLFLILSCSCESLSKYFLGALIIPMMIFCNHYSDYYMLHFLMCKIWFVLIRLFFKHNS